MNIIYVLHRRNPDTDEIEYPYGYYESYDVVMEQLNDICKEHMAIGLPCVTVTSEFVTSDITMNLGSKEYNEFVDFNMHRRFYGKFDYVESENCYKPVEKIGI